jgi:protein-L-isoaspartate(D-aspartate) O-methyltransferase
MDIQGDGIFMNKEDLIRHLEEETQVFKNKAIKDAFIAVDRADFVEDDYKVEAYEDYELPTHSGQTISKPTIVAYMIELLDPQLGDSVLDIGSGSGWTTALLAQMVGDEGKVIGLEIKPDLVKKSLQNIENYKHLPIDIRQAEPEFGLYKEGPYNRIISEAAFETKDTGPVELLLQLAYGGVMVVPIGDSLFKFEKVSDEEIIETEYPGFNFESYVG